jgi:arginase family enzyme
VDISIYFEAVSNDLAANTEEVKRLRMGDISSVNTEKTGFPDINGIQLAIIGINEERASVANKGCSAAPNEVRKYFYELFAHWNSVSIADLGNIKNGHTIDDTYFALREVLSVLLKMNIVPVIIGGSQDLTYANYLAYENIGRVINIASVDSLFDLGHDEHELNSRSWLSRIILHQPNFLFNFTNIGYQTYFVDQDSLELMKHLYFDINRLGNVRANLEESEPMIRNADIVSFDLSSIRAADAPGGKYAGPNGFTGEEACKIARYAGMSDKLSSIGFYEMNPLYDIEGRTAHLVAQMIWHFVDGFANRKGDHPEKDRDNYVKFNVHIEDSEEDLIFLKSKKSDRWWMDVSAYSNMNKKYLKHQFVPCSYIDYQQALNSEIPDRWWKVQQKLM